MQIQFYHLTATPLEAALPKLLEKAYAQNMRVLVKVADAATASALSTALWTYQDSGFLPHGTESEAHAERQPILLSASGENKNDATLLLVTDNTAPTPPVSIERLLDLFNGQDDATTASARARWKSYKNAGHELTYYQQTPQGGWEKKA